MILKILDSKFVTSMIWPIFIIIAYFCAGRGIIEELQSRVQSGAEFSIGAVGVSVGKAPHLDSDAPLVEDVLEEGDNEEVQEFAQNELVNFGDTPQKSVAQSIERDLAPPEELFSRMYYIVHAAQPMEFVKTVSKGVRNYELAVKIGSKAGDGLESVDKVVYHLHETFSPRDRTVTDPSDEFRLDLIAWGQFEIKADVYLKNYPKPIRLTRYLNF